MAKVMDYYVPSMGIEVEAVYWIPTRVTVDKREGHVIIQLTGYRDRESRQAGENVIDTKVWDLWNTEALDFIEGLVRCEYNAIKYIYEWVTNRNDVLDVLTGETRSFFAGAIDIFEQEEEREQDDTEEEQDQADEEPEVEAEGSTEEPVDSIESESGEDTGIDLSESITIPGGATAPEVESNEDDYDFNGGLVIPPTEGEEEGQNNG